MKVGIPKEIRAGETRVAATPDSVKKLRAQGLEVVVEQSAGRAAHFPDEAYAAVGAILGNAADALAADIVFKVHKPTDAEIAQMRRGALLVSFMELCNAEGKLDTLAQAGVDSFALELVPRISRAQTMDALSSQSNIAGYRAVLEAANLFGRFFPMMMTSAGSAKPARVIVLGAGVAGLQAIATARRLGAQVSAYDVRPEVKEQVMSLGARFIELDVGESGVGQGGYAKQLSESAQQRQVYLLGEELKKADIVISTALIPCQPAPLLISAEAIRGMQAGTVVIDMAAAAGGNCPLSKPDQTINVDGVIICGISNFAALMPADASAFYARNLLNFLGLLLDKQDTGVALKDYLADEISAAALVTYRGQTRYQGR
ncbi:MAG: Re/Si-specific NAD(P)(+) transhydrogenase subunit alpha [Gammaproteobacteria bacterium]